MSAQNNYLRGGSVRWDERTKQYYEQEASVLRHALAAKDWKEFNARMKEARL